MQISIMYKALKLGVVNSLGRDKHIIVIRSTFLIAPAFEKTFEKPNQPPVILQVFCVV